MEGETFLTTLYLLVCYKALLTMKIQTILITHKMKQLNSDLNTVTMVINCWMEEVGKKCNNTNHHSTVYLQ